MLRVLHICPTYFSPDSVVAGGERYSYDLARAMVRRAETTLLTFGDKAFVRKVDGLTIRCLKRLAYVRGSRNNPLSLGMLSELRRADVVHCHQYKTVVTDLAILGGLALRKPVFVTDLSGSASFSLSYHLPLHRGIRAFLMISKFNRDLFRDLPTSMRVIYGGVDPERFTPPAPDAARSNKVLFVGRLLPNKGIGTLIDAAADDIEVDVVGKPYVPQYLEQLSAATHGRRVVFDTDCSDAALVQRYRDAAVTAIPVDVDGGYTTALESMASGTPVVASRVGSLPELIVDGETGFLVPPRDPAALRARLRDLLEDPVKRAEMGARGRARVLAQFTWDKVVDRCLDAYRQARKAS